MTALTPASRPCATLTYMAVATLLLGLLLTARPATAAMFTECTTDEEAVAHCAPLAIDIQGRGSTAKSHCKFNYAVCHIEGGQDADT